MNFQIKIVEVHFNGDADSAIDVPRPEEDRTTAVSKKKDLQEQLKVCFIFDNKKILILILFSNFSSQNQTKSN